MGHRRQLTLFVPEPFRGPLEVVRRAVDPIQSALIPAHVTLFRDHDLRSMADVTRRLQALQRVSVRLSFARPEELADGCLLMRVSGATTAYDDLRRFILGDEVTKHGAHITLRHPRNATGQRVDPASVGLRDGLQDVHFEEVALIEQVRGGPWRVVDRYGAHDL